ncbi:hypothetical protein ES707_06655 [subsurface metagenome]
MGVLNKLLNLLIDLVRNPVTIVFLLRNLAPQEDQFLPSPEGAGAQLLAHPVFGDHLAGDLGCLPYVAFRPGGHFIKDQFLGAMPAKQGGQHIVKLRAGPQIAIFGGQEASVATHRATSDYRDLMHRVGVGKHPGCKGMARFMVSGDLLLLGADDPALPLRAVDHPVDGLLKLEEAYFLLIAPRRQDGCLIHQVGEVSARKARGLFGNDLQIG